MKKIILVCNAHIDPVWLWEWEEGVAEVLSTFRTAADFCDTWDGLVFNHNESILYSWIEEYDPHLFRRIQDLVTKGKWHIMGGWFLQPDCNMPSGESMVRQILKGRRYFTEKFGARPETAINFDSFGHNRGLVQLLVQGGYTSYLFCRPFQEDCPLPSDDFIWEGYDGSKIAVNRGFNHYLSLRGEARKKIEDWIDKHWGEETGLVLWGIGNHGGGPSKVDLEAITALQEEETGYTILHGTPEEYFGEVEFTKNPPKVDKNLTPWAAGCYTSMIRLKQKHRLLENLLYSTEKMSCESEIQGITSFTSEQNNIEEACYDLLLSEFHDILPGSATEEVEEYGHQLLDHGIEIVRRERARVFFNLLRLQKPAVPESIPVFCYNPHPYPVPGVFECEFNLPDQNWTEEITLIRMTSEGKDIPCQVEKESSNLNLDWRKKVSFHASLPPSSMSVFSCFPERRMRDDAAPPAEEKQDIIITTDDLRVVINCQTGLVDEYCIHGASLTAPGAFLPEVREDNADPWGSLVHSFSKVLGVFRLMNPEEAALFAGFSGTEPLKPVRIIEAGPVRTVVEALFSYNDSAVCQRYAIPKTGTELRLDMRIYWNEKDRFCKLKVPLNTKHTWNLTVERIFGSEEVPGDRSEQVFQKWAMAVTETEDRALICVNNGIYALDFSGKEVSFSLVRSPAYAALPIGTKPFVLEKRFNPRIDQGVHRFTFWFDGGNTDDIRSSVSRTAQIKNEAPFILSAFPPGTEQAVSGHVGNTPVFTLEPNTVICTAFKKAGNRNGYIIRVFETTGDGANCCIRFPGLNVKKELYIPGFKVKTFFVDPEAEQIIETGLLEEPGD